MTAEHCAFAIEVRDGDEGIRIARAPGVTTVVQPVAEVASAPVAVPAEAIAPSATAATIFEVRVIAKAPMGKVLSKTNQELLQSS